MDGEFVNVFIEKQRNLINEMQSKILLLETDLHFKTIKLNELQVALDKVNKKVKKAEDNTF